MTKMLLAAAGYVVIVFPLALGWHLGLFKEKYETFGYFAGEPNVLAGLAAIVIQGVVLARIGQPSLTIGHGVFPFSVKHTAVGQDETAQAARLAFEPIADSIEAAFNLGATTLSSTFVRLRMGALGLATSIYGPNAEWRYDGDSDASVPDGVNSRFAGDLSA